jgi:choline kinase
MARIYAKAIGLVDAPRRNSDPPLHAAAGPRAHQARPPRVQAVILAAGRGSRLSEAINDQPKCLAEVGGQHLVEHQLELLAAAGIDDVMVVTGYGADAVRRVVGRRARFVHNPLWEDTEGLFSLYLCRDWVRGPLLVLNCDVLPHPDVLQRLLARPGNAFAYDSSSGADPEQMAVELDGERLLAMRKDLPLERTHGENVGILYFNADAARIVFGSARWLLVGNAMRKRIASAVQMVAARMPMAGIDVADLSWIEIDFPEDLERARRSIWPAICQRPQRRSLRPAFAAAAQA